MADQKPSRDEPESSVDGEDAAAVPTADVAAAPTEAPKQQSKIAAAAAAAAADVAVRVSDSAVDVRSRLGEGAADVRDRFNSRRHAAARYVAQRWLMKPTVWSITDVTVIGRERLKGLEGGFVLIANHSSHLDAPLIVGALPRKLSRYLATGAAADYFFDVWWRRGLTSLFFNAFPIQRGRRGGDARKKASKRDDTAVSAASLLARGFPVLVFPEGTRSKDGEMGPFKPGAARLAAACDVPIVPLALIGANIAHPRGSHWPRPGRLPVGVAFGDPMRPEPDETAIAFSNRLRDEILRIRNQYSADILGRSVSSKGASQ